MLGVVALGRSAVVTMNSWSRSPRDHLRSIGSRRLRKCRSVHSSDWSLLGSKVPSSRQSACACSWQSSTHRRKSSSRRLRAGSSAHSASISCAIRSSQWMHASRFLNTTR